MWHLPTLRPASDAPGRRDDSPAPHCGGSPDHRPAYGQLVEQVRALVAAATPTGATVAVVSKGDDALLRLSGRRGWHFPRQEDGQYAGFHPADSAAAVAHLEDLRAAGVEYLVVPATARWWLDYYHGLRDHLEGRYRTALAADGVCVLYDLRGRDAGPAGATAQAPAASVTGGATRAEPVPFGLQVDQLVILDERTFFARGCLWDPPAAPGLLMAIAPGGGRAALDGAYRYPRTDARREPGTGFIAYGELDQPARPPGEWVFRLAGGPPLDVKAPAPVSDPRAARDLVLTSVDFAAADDSALLSDHIHPALRVLQARPPAAATVERVDTYGMPPPAPAVSVVVPLYGRVDLVEHQLAQLGHDPEIARADLVYVLDSPELADQLRSAARHLSRLFRVSFRVATLQENAGFSRATNAGAALARGRLLLLLNSDVIPDRPGWLGALAAFYDATPGVGALGPKLLYEDDSLQHAGLFFRRPDGRAEWSNYHYFKGLGRHLPAANVPRPVPAVSGACLLIARELYEHCGGLSGGYVYGDYEDSDLCLRLAAGGRVNWYLPHVELYHIEGQSYAGALRARASRYNRWLQTHLWGGQIEAVMARFEGGGGA
jgi:GT2 family glycosyltransferase